MYIFFFIFFGKGIIYKQNLDVSLETLLPEIPENYTINNETFIAWRIKDIYGKSSEIANIIKTHPFIETCNN